MNHLIKLLPLAAFNWFCWIVLFYLSWNDLAPESTVLQMMTLSLILGLPAGSCCGFWLLLNAQLHETGWRLALTVGIVFINSFAWAWLVRWPGRKALEMKGSRGFEVITHDDKEKTL